MTEYLDVRFSHMTLVGERFTVSHNGVDVIKSTKNPEHDGARYLADAGYTGRVVSRYNGRECIGGDIEQMAGRTVSENDKHGPRISKFAPFRAIETQDGED